MRSVSTRFAPLRRDRLYQVKAFALACTALCLIALAAPARAGHWVLTTTGSGQAMLGGGGMQENFTAPPPSTDSVNIPIIGAGGSEGPCFGGTPGTITATANLSVTVTGTWTPDGQGDDTTPQCVLLTESSTAYGSGQSGVAPAQAGQADDGWGDAPATTAQNGTPVGTSAPPTGSKYVQQSGGSFTVSLSLSASGTQGMYQGGCGANACVGPITISATTPVITLTGTHDPAHGDNQVLTGQQVTATLNGTIGTVNNYTWTVGGSAFKNYDPTLSSNQLVSLGSADLTGPASGGTSVAPVSFYDGKAESLTITCNATFTAPDGKTSLSVSAKSPQITVVKPTANWAVDPSSFTINGQTVPNVVGFHDNSATQLSYGVNTTWYPATISVPAPFSGGQGCFAQIVTPNATITRTPTGNGVPTYSLKIQNAQGQWFAPGTGIDGAFPYAFGFTTDANGNLTGNTNSSVWQAGGTGASGDNPIGQETVKDIDNGGSNWTSSSISDSFTTWLMFQPPGGVWIPLKKATWSASGNATGGPNNWSATGHYSPPAPMDTNDPPQWSSIISGQQYHP